MIAAVGSVLLTPWNLYNNPEVIHYTLETLGAFIGPLFGVLIADFYLVRKQKVVVDDLFTMSKTAQLLVQQGLQPGGGDRDAGRRGPGCASRCCSAGMSPACPPPRSTAGSSAAAWHSASTTCWQREGPWKMTALRVAEGATLVEN